MRNLLTAYMRQDPKQAINSQTSIDMLAQIFPNG
jgi:hypothetical protein